MSLDETLKKYYIKYIKNNNLEDKIRGTLEDILQWFRALGVFEKVKMIEADVTESFGKLQKKASTLGPQDFLDMVNEIAKKLKVTPDELKKQLIILMEAFDELEKQFWIQVEKGKAKLDDVVEWMRRNKVFDKAHVAEEEAKKALAQIQQSAGSNMTAEDIKNGVNMLAKKANIDVDAFLKGLLNPGFLPSNEPPKEDKKGETSKKK